MTLTGPESCGSDVPATTLPGAERLTPRELEVLATTAISRDIRQVADRLFISYFTVRAHLANAYRKLEVGRDVDAYRAVGWLTVPEEYR